MNWKNFFARLGGRKIMATGRELDKKLVSSRLKKFFPSWPQFKYLLFFLTPFEKRLILASVALVFFSIAGLSFLFIKSNLAIQPKTGGKYTEAVVGAPKYINPLYSNTNDVDQDLVSLIYSGLFKYDSEQKLRPLIAESYSISADQKTYEITLKEDVKWADGQPFSATDVAFTFELIQNPEVGSPLLSAFQGVKIEKISDYKISFTLKTPYAPFLDSLTVGMLPEHIWGNTSPAALRLSKFNLEPVGTGAWKFNKLTKDDSGLLQSYTLAPNNNYFFKRPYLTELTFKFYPDYDTAAEALRGQNADAISFIPHLAKYKLNIKNLNTLRLELPQYNALFFNQDKEPLLQNDDLRTALAMAIDKKILVSEILEGQGKLISGPIPEGSVGFYKESKEIAFDKTAANVLLDKKWPRIQPEDYFKFRQDQVLKSYNAPSSTPTSTIEKEVSDLVRNEMSPDQQFYRQDKDKKILSLKITTVDSPEYIKIAEFIAKQWRAAGIKTDIMTVNSRGLIRDVIKPHDYDILLYGEILGSDPDPFPFWHSSQINYPGLNLALYSNREADKALEEGRVETDPAKRSAQYKKFQEILAKDLPAIFLYTPIHSFVVNKNIKGIVETRLTSPSDRYNGIENWYTNTSWQWK